MSEVRRRDRTARRAKRPCGLCGQEIHGNVVLCQQCETLTRARIAEQPIFLKDLRAEMAREVARHEQESKRLKRAETPMPFNDQAARLIRQQRSYMVGWVRELAQLGLLTPPAGPFHARCPHESCLHIRSYMFPADTIREMAAFIDRYLFRWRTSEDLTRLAVDVAALNHWMLNALQAQKASRTVGPCPNTVGSEWCIGTVVLTRWLDESKAVEAECTACKQTWEPLSFSSLGRGIERRKAAEVQAEKEAAAAQVLAQAFVKKGAVA